MKFKDLIRIASRLGTRSRDAKRTEIDLRNEMASQIERLQALFSFHYAKFEGANEELRACVAKMDEFQAEQDRVRDAKTAEEWQKVEIRGEEMHPLGCIFLSFSTFSIST